VDPQHRHPRPPLVAIGLISAAALAYEILLMRLFSIIQWHHFAYMMISLALLGYGASGTFLVLARRRLQGHYLSAFTTNAVAFGVCSVSCFLAAQSLPFNALELFWDQRQPLLLLAIYLLLFIPFFCAANCICLSFSEYRDQLHRVYSADLLGAGLGAAGIIALLFLLSPQHALAIIGMLGWLTAAAACLELRARPRLAPSLAALVAAILLLPALGADLRLSQFKGLSQALRVTGAMQVDQRSGPLGLLTTVESPVVPFRHVPGMSLNTPVEPPAQKAVFTDGDGMSVITRFDGDTAPLGYLDYTTTASPYHLLARPQVLVLGAGGGADVLQALYQGAASVDAVELNGQMLDLVRGEFAEFGGAVYASSAVEVMAREARGFMASSKRKYDLIQLALLDSFAASSAGLFALSENYLYTVEAFEELIRHLEPGGILAVTRWLKLPPRDGLKVFATAVEALQRKGVRQPGDHLLMIRSWNTTTLLLGERAFPAAQVAALRQFCEERWFDLVWYPGMQTAEANRFNQLQEPWLHRGAVRLLSDSRAEFLDEYKFNVRPATDDRPHFFHFLKWRTLPEILTLLGQGGMPLLEQGYLLLVGTLAQAVLASLVLILLPLVFIRRPLHTKPPPRGRLLAYFAAVGMAFMLIEIAFIQKFILFLSHPLYAVAVVLAAFLVFAGLGSALSQRWSGRPVLPRVVAGISALALLYLLLLPSLFNALMHLADGYKVLISTALIAPLAMLMGMPFPLGLDRVARQAPGWIPWAWGVNGCASVVSAVLATLLAIHTGFAVVVMIAVVLYGLAAGSALPIRPAASG
jgi:SAM-dependent methyltransferase